MTQFAIERLLANLRNQLPGALDGALRLEIFNTLNTFFTDSNIWQETQSFNTRLGRQIYELQAENPDAYYTKLLLLEAYDPADAEGRVTMPTHVRAWLVSPTELRLHHPVTVVQRLRATFAVAPRPTDRMDQYPNIPDSYWDKYHDAFVEGVMARMMSQPAKPYSNERLGIFHGRRFKSATSMAKNDFYNGDIRGGQNWHFPQNFARPSAR
jgi:hypothetical protein